MPGPRLRVQWVGRRLLLLGAHVTGRPGASPPAATQCLRSWTEPSRETVAEWPESSGRAQEEDCALFLLFAFVLGRHPRKRGVRSCTGLCLRAHSSVEVNPGSLVLMSVSCSNPGNAASCWNSAELLSSAGWSALKDMGAQNHTSGERAGRGRPCSREQT